MPGRPGRAGDPNTDLELARPPSAIRINTRPSSGRVPGRSTNPAGLCTPHRPAGRYKRSPRKTHLAISPDASRTVARSVPPIRDLCPASRVGGKGRDAHAGAPARRGLSPADHAITQDDTAPWPQFRTATYRSPARLSSLPRHCSSRVSCSNAGSWAKKCDPRSHQLRTGSPRPSCAWAGGQHLRLCARQPATGSFG